MIKLKRLLKEYRESPYNESGDGWNHEFFREIGFLDFADTVTRMAYEINNARRGAYEISGDKWDDFVDDIEQLVEELNNFLEDIQEFHYEAPDEI